MRRPDLDLAVLALEFGAAVADQRVQRIGGGGDAERLHLVARRPRQRGGVFLLGGEAELLCQFGIERRDGRRGAVIGGANSRCGASSKPCAPPSPASGRGARVAGRADSCRSAALSASRVEVCAQGSDPSHSLLARRGPRAVRGGFAAGAAVPGIVRRRLQAGARAHAGIAAIDRGIEQFRQRRPDRLHVGPRRLGIWRFGFRGFAGFFGGVGILRHAGNMGAIGVREKGPIWRRRARFIGPQRGAFAGRSRFSASGKCRFQPAADGVLMAVIVQPERDDADADQRQREREQHGIPEIPCRRDRRDRTQCRWCRKPRRRGAPRHGGEQQEAEIHRAVQRLVDGGAVGGRGNAAPEGHDAEQIEPEREIAGPLPHVDDRRPQR